MASIDPRRPRGAALRARRAPRSARPQPLVRHGVALFAGSPPREPPWGRFIQLVPSGGYRDVRLPDGSCDEIVLGREEGDIVFRDDQFMSRRHAAVNWDGKRALLTDLGSSNGTFVRVMSRRRSRSSTEITSAWAISCCGSSSVGDVS